MKKYRSLWYMSTTNHNILYFVDITRIRFLNIAIRLWKAQNSLAPCGFLALNLPQTLCNQASAGSLSSHSEA
jgi:hypothetical protein